jgi:hypothetical protein
MPMRGVKDVDEFERIFAIKCLSDLKKKYVKFLEIFQYIHT